MKGIDLDCKKILITGASGFVGAVVLRKIVTDYPKALPIIILRKNSDLWRIKDLIKNVKVIDADLTDKSSLKEISKIKPDVIFHLAAYGAYPYQNDLNKAYKINLLGTLNLIQVLEQVNYELFVNAGTSSEYGYKTAPMKETDLLEPNSYYAASKASSTLFLQTYARLNNRPIITLRLFSVYGPYEEPTRFVPTLMRSIINGTEIYVPKKPFKRDFVYVEDVAEAFLGCDKREGVFNICSGIQTSIEDVGRMAVHLTGSRSKIIRGSEKRPWDTTFWVGDPTHTKKVLGWKAKTSLEEGIVKTYKWHKIYEV